MQGFIPTQDGKFSLWSEKYRRKLLEHAMTLGLTQTLDINVPANTDLNILTGDFTNLMVIKFEVTSVPSPPPGPPMPPSSLYLQLTGAANIPADLATAIEGVPGTTETPTVAQLGGDDKRYLHVRNPSPTVPGTCKITLASAAIFDNGSDIIEVQQHIISTGIKRDDWKQEASEKNTAKKTLVRDKLRPFIQHKIKASDTYTDAIGKDIDIIDEHIPVDPATLKPEIIALLAAGVIDIRWEKFVADGILFEKDSGDGKGFLFLDKDNEPDYQDTTPLPATAKVWKYRAMYLIKDKKVGQWSDVVSITVVQ